jgi:TRAP-type mannitol/chloroaromatic compound transport system permease small subunit
MHSSLDLRRVIADFGNRAGAASAYLLIALMGCLVIAEVFLRLMHAYS